METVVLLCGDASVEHFGLRPAERLERMFQHAGLRVVDQLSETEGPEDNILVIDGRYLYDDRLLKQIMRTEDTLLRQGEDQQSPLVAAHVKRSDAPRFAEAMSGPDDSQRPAGTTSPKGLLKGIPHKLLKAQLPFVVKAKADRKKEDEQLLYDASYKGVTDLVTKWAWPRPAQSLVRVCTRFGIQPNHITVAGFTLMLAALVLFYFGHFGWGLVCGWIMTFFDTVDGKLARTTVSISPFGHYLDKITDIIHPPFWYLAWGLALTSYQPPAWGFPTDLNSGLWIIFGGYLAGRLVEIFTTGYFVKGGIFVWRPLDSYFRLIAARRNPCLILMTLSLAFQRPDIGLWSVSLLTAASAVFLFVRMILAAATKPKGDRHDSWLLDADPNETPRSRAVSWFAVTTKT